MSFSTACAVCIRRYASRTSRIQSLRTLAKAGYATDASSSTAIEVTDPLALYENLVRSGRIQWDEEQVRLLVQLRHVHDSLVDYKPSQTIRHLLETSPVRKEITDDAPASIVLPNIKADRSLVKALTHEDDLSTLDSPTGFLLTGSVGTGKTMLLDLFYNSLPVSKRRIHYHAFLLGLYRKVFLALENQRVKLEDEEAAMQSLAAKDMSRGYPWSMREENKAKALTKGWRHVFAGGRKFNDPLLVKEYVLANVALDLVKEATVLAFDEVQLVDIAGAGILRRVLTWYWRLGGVVIGTSNRLPSDLYEHGIQKAQFEAFLAHLQQRCPVYEMRSENDWRRRARASDSALLDGADRGIPSWSTKFEGESTWFTDKTQFEKTVQEITGEEAQGSPARLSVYGRGLAVPWHIDGQVARFTFSQLCELALGPADYLTLTSKYPTIIIDAIPQLKLSAKNEARRFITFLDAAYEAKTRLVCFAASAPDNIFFPDAAKLLAAEDNPLAQEMIGDVMHDLEAPYRPNVSSYQETEVVQARAEAAMEEAQTASPAFKSLAIFTGQDEQFAYRRALSRIFEITSAEFVKSATHAPIPDESRVWEHAKPSIPRRADRPPAAAVPPSDLNQPSAKHKRGVKVNPLDESLDISEMPKPKIASTHIWGIIDTWGKGAGIWGQGVKAKEDIQKAEQKARIDFMQEQGEKL